MPPKAASPARNVLAFWLNYFAGALFLLNAVAILTGWDNFANRPRSDAYLDLALSVVFFSVGAVFMASRRKAR